MSEAKASEARGEGRGEGDAERRVKCRLDKAMHEAVVVEAALLRAARGLSLSPAWSLS